MRKEIEVERDVLGEIVWKRRREVNNIPGCVDINYIQG